MGRIDDKGVGVLSVAGEIRDRVGLGLVVARAHTGTQRPRGKEAAVVEAIARANTTQAEGEVVAGRPGQRHTSMRTVSVCTLRTGLAYIETLSLLSSRRAPKGLSSGGR